MARKRIECKPTPEIELAFEEGESILLRFDISALMAIQELEGGLNNLMEKSVPEMCAVIMYGAGKEHNANFTLERAREIISNLSVSVITEIYEEFTDAMTASSKQEKEELAKKVMAQYLELIAK